MNEGARLFEGDAGPEIEADALIKTVEGSESPLSYALVANRPVLKEAGVALGAPVDPELLIAFLRSDRPMSRRIRNWLADMLDRQVKTDANLKLSARAGHRKSNMLQYRDEVEAYVDRREAGDGYDAAIAHVVRETGITEGLLKKAVKRLGEGVEIQRNAQRRS